MYKNVLLSISLKINYIHMLDLRNMVWCDETKMILLRGVQSTELIISV